MFLFNLPPPPGFRSTSQSMTVAGMMCVGLSSPSLSPSTTQVAIYFVLNLSTILLFPEINHLVNWNDHAKKHLITMKMYHLTLYQDLYGISIISSSELTALQICYIRTICCHR